MKKQTLTILALAGTAWWILKKNRRASGSDVLDNAEEPLIAPSRDRVGMIDDRRSRLPRKHPQGHFPRMVQSAAVHHRRQTCSQTVRNCQRQTLQRLLPRKPGDLE